MDKKLTEFFFFEKESWTSKKNMKKKMKKKSSKILNFIIDLQQYNPYDALMVKNYNKKSLFLSFQDFQDFSGTGAGIPGKRDIVSTIFSAFLNRGPSALFKILNFAF